MRSPSPSSDSGGAGSSGSGDSEAADPHQAAIEKRRGRAPVVAQRPVGDAGLVVHYVDERAGGADAAGGVAAAATGGAPHAGALRCHASRAVIREVSRAASAGSDACASARAGSARRGGAAREGTPEEGGAGVDEWAGESEEMRRLLRQPRYYDDDFEAVRVRIRFRCAHPQRCSASLQCDLAAC